MSKLLLVFAVLTLFCQTSCNGQYGNKAVYKEKIDSTFYVVKEEITEKEYLEYSKISFIVALDSTMSVTDNAGSLEFTLSNGIKKTFSNYGAEDDLDYRKYAYLANLNQIFALFSVDGYEYNDLFLINIVDGTKTDLISFPYPNKTTSMFFTYSNNIEVDYLENKIELYSLRENKMSVLSHYLSEKEMAPIDMFWISENQIIVKLLRIDEQEHFIYERWEIKRS